MTLDDTTRSVRVEVEGTTAPIPEVPELQVSGSGPSRWPIVFIVLLVMAVGGALVWLSPEGGETADGSERAVPTTVAPEEADADPEVEISEAVEVLDESSPLLAPSDAPFGMSSVVRTDDGFFGLGQIRDGEGPVYFSTNAVDWDPINPRFPAIGAINLRGLYWTDLRLAEGSFALASENQVFFSDDAMTWNRLRTERLRAEGATPVVAFDNRVIGAAIDGVQPVDELLREHTNIDVSDAGVCSILLTPTASPGLEVRACDRTTPEVLNASNAVGEAPFGDVISCILSLGLSDTGFPRQFQKGVSLHVIDVAGNGPTRLGGPGATWNLVGDVAPLSGGRIAFADAGFSSDGSCDGLIDLPTETAPAMVVLDLATGTEQRVDLPDRLLDLGDVVVLGEIGTASPQHLLVEVGGTLEILSIEAELWSALDPGPNEDPQPEPSTGGANAVSVTGQRAYRLNSDGLQVWRLASTSERTITEAQWLIELDEDADGAFGFPVGSLDVAEIIFADDSVVLFQGLGEQVWRINVDATSG